MEERTMGFNASEKNIADIFNKTNYDIPRNQRRYVWDKKNWKEIIEDIFYVAKDPKSIHFLGSIVLKDQGKADGISQYTIIDGQQRLTTIALILVAILKLLEEMEMNDDYHGTCDYLQSRDLRNKQILIINSEYHSSLECIIKNIVDINKITGTKIDNFIKINTINKSKDKIIGEAICYFYEIIKKNINDSSNPTTSLLTIRNTVINMSVVSIVATTDEDSYTIFEILNARGQELEDYELLKNYIMRYIEPKGNRDIAKAIWEGMEETLRTYMKKYIFHYTRHRFKVNSSEKKSDYEIIKNGTREIEKKDLLDDLKLKSEYYSKLVDFTNCQQIEKEVFEFFKSKRHELFRPLLLSLIHQNELGNISEALYNEIIKYIYIFYICYSVIGTEQSNTIQDFIYKYALLLENEFSENNLKKFLQGLKCRIVNRDHFDKSFNNIGYSNHYDIYKTSKFKNQVRIILEVIEKLESGYAPKEGYTIEHILPDSQSDKHANIGNLLLLEEKLNEKCKDKELNEKIQFYLKSSFVSTRQFAERYLNKEFNIDRRAKFLADKIYDYIDAFDFKENGVSLLDKEE